ncbi:cytochrome P450, partial [Aureobasidium melanogenum]
MPSDEERSHLVSDVLQILVLGLRVLLSICYNLVTEIVHLLDILLSLLLVTAVDVVINETWAAHTLTTFGQDIGHLLSERMSVIRVELVESIRKSTKSNGVESQACQVIAALNFVFWSQTIPLQYHLRRDIEHVFTSESRFFVESFLVANFIDVLLISEYDLFVAKFQLHDRAIQLLHTPYVLGRKRGIQVRTPVPLALSHQLTCMNACLCGSGFTVTRPLEECRFCLRTIFRILATRDHFRFDNAKIVRKHLLL